MPKHPPNNNSFLPIPGIKMGLTTPERLVEIAAVAKKFHVSHIKITTAQRLAFIGFQENDKENILKALGNTDTDQPLHNIQYVQVCPGKKQCKYGCRDTSSIDSKLNESLHNLNLPAKVKIGISGCAMNCCGSFIKDVGIFAKTKGWTVVFGGNGGSHPRIGDIIGEELRDDAAVALVRACLDYYAQHGRKKERSARFMERIGEEKLMKMLLEQPK